MNRELHEMRGSQSETFAELASSFFVKFPPRSRDEFDVPELHHYTTAAGLVGILNDGSILASGVRHSSDLSEVNYAYRIGRDVTQSWARAQQSGVPVQSQFRQDVCEFFSKADRPFYDGYVFCCCEHPDLLSQWRAYASSGGFALTFHPIAEHGKVGFESPSAISLMLRRIDYNEESQRTTLKQILTTMDEIVRAVEDKYPGKTDLVAAMALASLQLNEWVYTVKDRGFSEEQEWRLIAFPKMKVNLFGTKYENYDACGVRAVGNRLVPYMRLSPTGGLLPLTRIVCGPSSYHELTEEAARFLAVSKGYKVEVTSTTIPIRS